MHEGGWSRDPDETSWHGAGLVGSLARGVQEDPVSWPTTPFVATNE